MDVNEKAIQVRQDLVSVSQISEIPYPCLLTIDKDTCVPRLPSYLLKKATADRPIRILSFENMPDQDLSRYGLVGSPRAEITNEHSIRQYLDYLVRNKGWTKSSGLIPIYTSPCGKKGCYADWEMQIYDCHHKKKLTTAEIAAFFEQFQ